MAQNFIKICLSDKELQVEVFSENLEQDDLMFYEKNHVTVYQFTENEKKVLKSRNYIKRAFIRYKYMKFLRSKGEYDIINVQYVTYGPSWLASKLKSRNTRFILSYWGSDLFRMPPVYLTLMCFILKKVDNVTFDNIDLEQKFQELYGKKYKGESICAYFGLPILEDIERQMKNIDKKEAKEKIGINEKKTVIAVGYNGRAEQQHHEVINAIKQLESRYKNKIVILLQMTYGGTENYIASIEEEIQKSGIEYKICTQFLSDEEVAILRIATDIYINSQTTDAFSGSVCENLYCGNVLFNASWLKYKELDKYGITYVEWNDFNQITKLLMQYLDGEMNLKTMENKNIISKLRKWDNCIINWKKIFIEK